MTILELRQHFFFFAIIEPKNKTATEQDLEVEKQKCPRVVTKSTSRLQVPLSFAEATGNRAFYHLQFNLCFMICIEGKRKTIATCVFLGVTSEHVLKGKRWCGRSRGW